MLSAIRRAAARGTSDCASMVTRYIRITLFTFKYTRQQYKRKHYCVSMCNNVYKNTPKYYVTRTHQNITLQEHIKTLHYKNTSKYYKNTPKYCVTRAHQNITLQEHIKILHEHTKILHYKNTSEYYKNTPKYYVTRTRQNITRTHQNITLRENIKILRYKHTA